MDLDLQHRDIARDANDVAARLAYFQKKEPVPGSVPITREAGAEPWPGNTELPEINACDLTVEKLRSAMARKGCLIVRDFFDAKRVDEFKSAIDQIIDEAVDALPLLLKGDPVKAMTQLHSIDTTQPG